MVLPPALQARLLKRGILRAEPVRVQNPEEEIIAEDYDDQHREEIAPPTKTWLKDKERKEAEDDDEQDDDEDMEDDEPDVSDDSDSDKENLEASGCPNKWNIHHECTLFCHSHWGTGRKEPDQDTEKKRIRMLKKYSLPEGWQEVYDPGTGRHYYWNTLTDDVSWLPPGHPRAKVSLPACKLREQLKREERLKAVEEDSDDDKDEAMDEDEDKERKESSSSEDESDDEEIKKKKRRPPLPEVDTRAGRGRGRFRGKVKANDLDPMDPAAYSEIPRGTWSTGLERKGEAKTAADTTASGPLYQMRPYPSPGAVLRANAKQKEVESEDSE